MQYVYIDSWLLSILFFHQKENEVVTYLGIFDP